MPRKEIIKKIKRIVLKIGSGVLALPQGGLNEEVIKEIALSVKHLKDKGLEVVIVSSGAILAGVGRLKLKERPRDIPTRQAAAAIGQTHLMWLYEKQFNLHQMRAAQILLTHDDLSNRRRYINAKNTVDTLLRHGVIPVINENDTVVVEEIKLGDNDHLSGLVTALVEADMLVILSDIDGIYSSDPKKEDSEAQIIDEADANSPEIQKIKKGTPGAFAGTTFCDGSNAFCDNFGTGGIKTKIEAAEKAASFGIATIIANGKTPGILNRIFSGEKIGTLIHPGQDRLSGRKHWIAHALKPKGTLLIDGGACSALKSGKSLLPSGIREVEGSFEAGDCVSLGGAEGEEIARGLVNYNSEDIRRIRGKQTSQIEDILGYKYFDEVIHRNDMAFVNTQNDDLSEN